MTARINTLADLLKATALTAGLREILDKGVYAFTPEPLDDAPAYYFEEDDENAAPEKVEARFWVKAVDMPANLSDADTGLIWNCLSAFERNGCLDIEVYRSDRDNFIADFLICCGGPTVRARYESNRELLTVVGSWGNSRFEIEARREDFEGTPLADLIELAAYRE